MTLYRRFALASAGVGLLITVLSSPVAAGLIGYRYTGQTLFITSGSPTPTNVTGLVIFDFPGPFEGPKTDLDLTQFSFDFNFSDGVQTLSKSGGAAVGSLVISVDAMPIPQITQWNINIDGPNGVFIRTINTGTPTDKVAGPGYTGENRMSPGTWERAAIGGGNQVPVPTSLAFSLPALLAVHALIWRRSAAA